MKKVFLILSLLTIGFLGKAQLTSGTYFGLGTSVDHHDWTQEAQFGGYHGKHQFGILVETVGSSPVDSPERQWFGGVAYKFIQPVAQTIGVYGAAKAKTNFSGENEVYFQPGVGAAFSITDNIRFDLGVGAKIDYYKHHSNDVQGQGDAALVFKF